VQGEKIVRGGSGRQSKLERGISNSSTRCAAERKGRSKGTCHSLVMTKSVQDGEIKRQGGEGGNLNSCVRPTQFFLTRGEGRLEKKGSMARRAVKKMGEKKLHFGIDAGTANTRSIFQTGKKALHFNYRNIS